MHEKWKPVPWAPDYDASTHGRVRSWRLRGGKGRRAVPLILKPDVVSGYAMYTLYTDEEKVRKLGHVIILETWRCPCPPGKEARHFPDNDRLNNRLSNLSWAAHKENCADQRIHGTALTGDRNWTRQHPELLRRGDAHHKTKLPDDALGRIQELRAKGFTQKQVGHQLGLSQSQISKIELGHSRL